MKDVCKHRAVYRKPQFLQGNPITNFYLAKFKHFDTVNRCEAISTPHKRVPQISNINSIRPAQRQKSLHNSSMIDVGGKTKSFGELEKMFCNVVIMSFQVNLTAIAIADARS